MCLGCAQCGSGGSPGEAGVRNCLVEVGWVEVGLSLIDGMKVACYQQNRGEEFQLHKGFGLQKGALGIRVGKEAE